MRRLEPACGFLLSYKRLERGQFKLPHMDAPGVRRHIRPSDLPRPQTSDVDPEASSASNVNVVDPPQGALPKVPDGFAVEVFASGFKQPRTLRVAPNGDIFLSESGTGRVLVFPARPDGSPAKPEVFAENLDRPYGIVFQPPANPRYVYVAAANQVVRYPYRAGATKPAGPAKVVVGKVPTKRHWTRDLAVSRDGKRLVLAVGSASNLAGGMPEMTPERIRRHEKTHGRGAAWGGEEDRAVVRVFDPEGKRIRNYATGLRNCSGLAMQPGTDNLWCVVNERDHLGPNLVPRDAFPAEYRGDAFVALHGSHGRPERTGYKVIRVRMKDGRPTGEYEDFMTGFLIDNDRAWGRPAGVAVTLDGALLVSDDANGTIFRVTRK